MTLTLNSNTTFANNAQSIKFLYSYGGKILPRRTDGKLCYAGGHTRVLSVDRSITFSELMVRLGELCGMSMCLKCKLPSEDLDVLISITCDEDLASVIDEYDRYSYSAHKDLKIRAVLFPVDSLKNISPTISTVSSVISSSPPSTVARSCRSASPAVVGLSAGVWRSDFKAPYRRCLGAEGWSTRRRYLYHVPH